MSTSATTLHRTTTTTTTTTTLRHHTLPPPTPTADIPPGARRTPLQIGLQLTASPRPSTETPTYDSHIMHRPIPPTLFDLTVTTDASIPHLAATFNIPIATVATHWLTSRSPMELPGYDRRVGAGPRPRSTRRYMPVAPSVVDKYHQLAVQLNRKLEHHVVSSLQTHATDLVAQFDDAQCSPRAPQERVARKEHDARVQRCVKPMTVQREKSAPRPECGFSKLGTHAQLSLSEDRRVVRKWGQGLYRVALGSGAAKGAYAEFEVGRLGGEGGLAVGVAPAGHVLNRLAGSDARSAGLHAAGMIVTESGEWRKVCDRLEEGDVVGVAAVGKEVEFYVNGKFVGGVGAGIEVECVKFVTCLYHVGAEVRLRCCKDEWEYFEAVLKRVSEGLRASCSGVEDVEANMSSTSVASGSNDVSWKNEPSPVDKHLIMKEMASCESAVTP